jgi:ribonuclease HI
MNLDPSLGVAVFTDGSASNRDKSGGWGYVALDAFEGIYTSSGYRAGTTISRMELAAPTYALEYLNEVYGACDVLVYSDSEYVVLGVNDRTRKRSANKDWWVSLDLAIEKHNEVKSLPSTTTPRRRPRRPRHSARDRRALPVHRLQRGGHH